MYPKSNLSPMTEPVVTSSMVLRHGFRLGAVASGIGSILFVVFYLVCQLVHRGSLNGLVDLERTFLILFLIIGPLLGLAVALLPGILGGGILAVILWRFSMSWFLSTFVGMLIGGLLGYVCAEIGNNILALDATIGSSCYQLSGILAGSMAGIWQCRKLIP